VGYHRAHFVVVVGQSAAALAPLPVVGGCNPVIELTSTTSEQCGKGKGKRTYVRYPRILFENSSISLRCCIDHDDPVVLALRITQRTVPPSLESVSYPLLIRTRSSNGSCCAAGTATCTPVFVLLRTSINHAVHREDPRQGGAELARPRDGRARGDAGTVDSVQRPFSSHSAR
jgi:hypothetical protein